MDVEFRHFYDCPSFLHLTFAIGRMLYRSTRIFFSPHAFQDSTLESAVLLLCRKHCRDNCPYKAAASTMPSVLMSPQPWWKRCWGTSKGAELSPGKGFGSTSRILTSPATPPPHVLFSLWLRGAMASWEEPVYFL